MGKDNALSFVGQIMTAYKAITKAEGTALAHAIECGKYLALAKENVEAARPKRKWAAWLSEHCPDIHRNTAALYMRLAENEEKIADCASIREADMKLRQPSQCGDGDSGDESDDGDAQRVVQEDDAGDEALRERVVRKLVSQDLKCTLENVGVDEVSAALIEVWDADQLRDLIKRVNAHLITIGPTPVPKRELAGATL
jgi:hypothetical protein